MMLWLFFTIFGLVLFLPSTLLVLLFNRFRNTIVLLIKDNGSLTKIIITDKELAIGEVTKNKGKGIIPIKVSKDEVISGKWRRWIIKDELISNEKLETTNQDVEDHLNNEDLIKLSIAGKFKDTLLLLLYITIGCIIVAGLVNGYLTNTHQCIISQDNSTREFIVNSVRTAIIKG